MAFYSSVSGWSTDSPCKQLGRFRARLSSLVGYGVSNLRPAGIDMLPALGSVSGNPPSGDRPGMLLSSTALAS